ncbi:transcription-repair coupling factor [Thermaerobacter composti]|uniref:Transcription-repair-coupling factor n=1 Tax=Thermaerobacter composti TaxID=554949 RepID=A0ABZ0QNT6_9FIRM|nr:transcription-repair coupling factor [Thermaerobacter composti]WPD19151.1 transcription-repair coupling factor [Thermaerobacter composti]
MTGRPAQDLTDELLRLWQQLPEFPSLAGGVRRELPAQAVHGIAGSAAASLLVALAAATGRTLFVLTADQGAADALAADLRAWVPADGVVVFPAIEVLPFEVLATSPELAAARLQALARIRQGPCIVVAPVAAVARRLPHPEQWAAGLLDLEPGQGLERDALLARLVAAGYQRVEQVERPGELAARGGIVDVYPPAGEPLRIEFFGDEIESLRRFDPTTQRSTERLDRAQLVPARELVLDEPAWRRGLARLAEELERLREQTRQRRGGAVRQLLERLEQDLARLEAERAVDLAERYLPLFVAEMATLLDYAPGPALAVGVEPRALEEAVADRERQWQERQADLLVRGEILPAQASLYLDAGGLWRALASRPVLYLSLLARAPGQGPEPRQVFAITARPAPMFHGQWDLFEEEIRTWQRQHYRVLVVAGDEERARRVQQALAAGDVAARSASALGVPDPGEVRVAPAALSEGFEVPALRWVVLTEREVLGRRVARRRSPTAAAERAETQAQALERLVDLKPGDYVVHVHHGIGRFLGLRTMEIQGVHRDYLTIQYAGGDRLYVPTDQIELVQKYVGAEGHQPRLAKLGSGEWHKVKQRVKESVRELAGELLALYAARQAVRGHAFSPDTPWQRQFEDAFPYQETPDQLAAIAAVKADMERPVPMDRLLVGDVGFGKTEVAMRAAFKAVQDGKQVAVLVPTTVLAYQHERTFKERFAPFPVTIRTLSRFASPAEQAEILTGLAQGTIDIVIGTHRLVQPDVRFKDLGLLIIDEEHRFGVAHKERLKQLKQNVDVLTLSATPIPRTLHMALAGIRDLSRIDTPPENRFPVQTFVVEWHESLVRDAIQRELRRGGQVFYVHNRVQSIQAVRRRLERLVPEARFAVAHGQMPEGELERVMVDFMAGKADVLVCTTIIESGLDMPNVNTLIVEDADRFGLAQLYQLRGRVGRSDRVAYAYFTYRRDKVLTEDAQKRLQAIKDFTELGAGFKLALRDLEIRGAGNLLGPEQHGFMLSVGFDLYAQLLEEAVAELRGRRRPARLKPVVDLVVDAHIPDGYIRDARQKIEFYKRVNLAETPAELAEVREALQDRYGPPPEPVRNLLALAEIRQLASRCGVFRIEQQGTRIDLEAVPPQAEALARTCEALRPQLGRRLQPVRGRPAAFFRTDGLGEREVLTALRRILRELWRHTPGGGEGAAASAGAAGPQAGEAQPTAAGASRPSRR